MLELLQKRLHDTGLHNVAAHHIAFQQQTLTPRSRAFHDCRKRTVASSPVRDMFITQTFALVLDAYRELNSRKLFWISVAISGLIVLIFAAVGIDQNGVVIFWAHFPNTQINTRFLDRGVAYKTIFEDLGINIWLTWAAPGLALISTASLFPDFLAGGAIDLYLSKPIGRLRLFLTKYVSGLLFVALQIIVFCVASFLVIGVRGGVWERAIFVSVPLTVLFFSYLYAVMVFFGIVTRSTIASLLLTLLVWGGTVAVHLTERSTLQFSLAKQMEAQAADRQVQNFRTEIDHLTQAGAHLPDPASTRPSSYQEVQLRAAEGSLEQAKQDREEITDSFASWHRAAQVAEWPLPKTTLTYDLMKRMLGQRMRLHREPPDDRFDDGGPDGSSSDRNTGDPNTGDPNTGDRNTGDPTAGNRDPGGRNQIGDPRSNENRGAGGNLLAGRRFGLNVWMFLRRADAEADRIEQGRSAFYVIGTSLLFELALGVWTCFIFCRRDF